MNIYGKKKFTYYFINLLVKQYGLLSSSLKETEQEKWDLSFRYTEAFFEKYEDCVSKHQVKELYETYSLTKELDEKMNKKNSFMRNNHMFTNRKDYFVPIILKH